MEKKISKNAVKLVIIILIISGIFFLIAGAVYFLTIADGTYKEDDWSNPMFTASEYTKNTEIDENGSITTEMTPQEAWDKLVENNSVVTKYLSGPKSLAKLMKAELVTQYPDLRENPDAEINWDKVLDTETKDVQGIIKLKRNLVESKKNVSEELFEQLTKQYKEYLEDIEKNQKKNKTIVKESELYDVIENSNGSYTIGEGTFKGTDFDEIFKQYAEEKKKIVILRKDAESIQIADNTYKYGVVSGQRYEKALEIVEKVEGNIPKTEYELKEDSNEYFIGKAKIDKDFVLSYILADKIGKKQTTIKAGRKSDGTIEIDDTIVSRNMQDYNSYRVLFNMILVANGNPKKQTTGSSEEETTLGFDEWIKEKGYMQNEEGKWEQGETSTMVYANPTTFQQYIDEYKKTGSEEAKKQMLTHFTLQKSSNASSNTGTTGQLIENGDTIEIPEPYGQFYTYMGWQCITDPTSLQYKLREQAGMNFDEEGFGKINGRYVIACTTLFGKVGDYIDFYLEDGTVIPCIIGDSKGSDANSIWGHEGGLNVVEFVINRDTWYYSRTSKSGNSNLSSRMGSSCGKGS